MMNFTTEKISGLILLAVGVLMMILCALNIFMIFTKQATPVALFDFPGVSLDLGQAISGSLPAGFVPTRQAESMKTEIVSGAVLNGTANLFAHVLLVGFLLNVGFKIASLGIQLLRPIVIKAKE